MTLKRRRVTKKLIKQERRVVGKERHTLACKVCGIDVPDLGAEISAVTCWKCVAKMAAPPDLPAKPKPPEERRPRGWQFMKEYRAPDGTLYHRGEKVNEEIPTEPKGRSKRSSVRKTAASTKSKSDDSRHPKKSASRGTGKRNRTSGDTGTKRVTKSAAKKVTKRKARRPAV